ncbi:MAG: glycosyltransferase family A protein [Rikenellaceae bacterium]
MSNQPLVSIIMPIYNMEAFLAESLDSVLATEYPALEVVLVDDGSTDSSLKIAEEYATRDSRLHIFTQPNSGACAARNHAVRVAKGEFILPVDGDNLITPDFVSLAVAEIQKDNEVKVVCPRAFFIGDKTGEWILPKFSLNLLARKNLMDTTALYRKADWVRIGGYCDELMTREDWDFWISMLKDGGKVVRLTKVTFYYRRRAGSKRIRGRKLKQHVTDILNRRHAEFFERELGGPLQNNRSWSKVINKYRRIMGIKQ